MILHLVTDRRRLAAPSPAPTSAASACFGRSTTRSTAGIDVVQIRERDLDARELAALVRDAVGTRPWHARPDRRQRSSRRRARVRRRRRSPARRLDASGVVRAIAPDGFLIGRSVHSRRRSQRRCDGVGLSGRRNRLADPVEARGAIPARSRRACGDRGGGRRAGAGDRRCHCRTRPASCAAAGAAGIAGIGLFLDATRTGVPFVQLRDTVAALRRCLTRR